MSKRNYTFPLRGYVGSYGFDAEYVNYQLSKNKDSEVNVLIDSLGGNLATALSIASAFKDHGNVNVHFVGMNASAATIVSLGAKHVSMDSSAMYLVHKCSMEFFEWASANSDKLQDIIDEATQMKTDLEKMDANVAKMYAKKCKRKPSDLLALMEQGGWLTAEEALDWGFVDELTDYEDDEAPRMTASVSAFMSEHNIPIPEGFTQEMNSTVMSRFIESLSNFFKSNTRMETKPTSSEQDFSAEIKDLKETIAKKDKQIAEMEANAKTMQKSVEELEKTVADQNKEISALKAAPGDTTRQVIEDGEKSEPSAESDVEAFARSFNSARKLYDSLP